LATIYYLRGDWKRKRLLDEVHSDTASLEDSAERQMAMEEGLPFQGRHISANFNRNNASYAGIFYAFGSSL
jgi:hypothetical protein